MFKHIVEINGKFFLRKLTFTGFLYWDPNDKYGDKEMWWSKSRISYAFRGKSPAEVRLAYRGFHEKFNVRLIEWL